MEKWNVTLGFQVGGCGPSMDCSPQSAEPFLRKPSNAGMILCSDAEAAGKQLLFHSFFFYQSFCRALESQRPITEIGFKCRDTQIILHFPLNWLTNSIPVPAHMLWLFRSLFLVHTAGSGSGWDLSTFTGSDVFASINLCRSTRTMHLHPPQMRTAREALQHLFQSPASFWELERGWNKLCKTQIPAVFTGPRLQLHQTAKGSWLSKPPAPGHQKNPDIHPQGMINKCNLSLDLKERA